MFKMNKVSAPAAGVLYGLCAYSIWGLFPLLWSALGEVPAAEILAHRVVWSTVFTAAAVTLGHGWPEVRASLRHGKVTFMTTALLISSNWLLSIWAVHTQHVMDSSLGFFMAPLASILLGVLLLRERLGVLQRFAVWTAGLGVVVAWLAYQRFPWIGLSLAVTTALYGLLRKRAALGSLAGLAVENLLLAPGALAYLGLVHARGADHFLAGDNRTRLLLIGAGAATAVPLLCYVSAARRLRLATLGFLQYLHPVVHFALALLVYREAFTASQMITFGSIWVALCLYLGSLMRGRARHLHKRTSDPTLATGNAAARTT